MLASFASAPTRRRIGGVGLAIAAACGGGCGHDWDPFDPRLGAAASGGGATSSVSGPGAGGATTSAATAGTGADGGGRTAASSSSVGSAGAGGTGAAGGAAGAGGAGGIGTTCAVNGTQTVTDDFDDGVAGAQWQVYSDNVTVTEAGGAAVFDLAPGSLPSTYAQYGTVATYDFTDCEVFAKIVEVPSASTQGYGALSALVSDGNYLELIYVGGDLNFVYWLGGNYNSADSGVPYDPTTHVYWRLREAAGTTYWETSEDGQAFVVQASIPNPLPVDAMQVRITAGTYQLEPVAPGKIRYDAVNLVR